MIRPVVEAAGMPHPWQRPDRAHPVGEGRDETEILLDMLLADKRVGITRPVDKVMVGPNTVSSMKMPSAWCRSARCRKSAAMLFDWSNQAWSGGR
jgi:hypothetical protein